MTNSTDVSDVEMTRFGYRFDLIREGHVRVKDEAKIASRSIYRRSRFQYTLGDTFIITRKTNHKSIQRLYTYICIYVHIPNTAVSVLPIL